MKCYAGGKVCVLAFRAHAHLQTIAAKRALKRQRTHIEHLDFVIMLYYCKLHQRYIRQSLNKVTVIFFGDMLIQRGEHVHCGFI